MIEPELEKTPQVTCASHEHEVKRPIRGAGVHLFVRYEESGIVASNGLATAGLTAPRLLR